jgi:hypothetical protein
MASSNDRERKVPRNQKFFLNILETISFSTVIHLLEVGWMIS